MKNYQIQPGDGSKIAGGSFTLAEIKTAYNALALDVESDKAGGISDAVKVALLAKLDALIFVWID